MSRFLTLSLALAALASIAGCPTGAPYVTGAPRARMETIAGEIVIELDPNLAPVTVDNFTQYVNDGFYDGTLFHRVVPGFVIQGGGYVPGLTLKDTRPPIPDEGYNGLKNLRGTIAMARTDDPSSATSQFYINLANNTALDATLSSPGYAVFGRVVQGMDVVDAIAAEPTTTVNDTSDVPVTDVVIESITLEEGERTLSSSWSTFLASEQYNLEVYLHDTAVSVLSAWLSG